MWQKAGKSWPGCRKPERPANWLTFRKFGFFSWMSLISCKSTIWRHCWQDTAIDVLINNAGIYGDNPRRGFGQLDYAAWMHTLTVNTQAPVKMAEAFFTAP